MVWVWTAFVVGAIWLQQWQALTVALALGALGTACAIAGLWWAYSRRLARWHLVLWMMLALFLGFLMAALQAQWRSLDVLAVEHDNEIFVLPIEVASLVQGDASTRRFMARLSALRPTGVPRNIWVSWRAQPGAQVPDLIPGQRWRAALVLRRPYAAANPHAPDGEARLFARGVRAMATVRGRPGLLDEAAEWRLGLALQRARHRLRAELHELVHERRYGGVLIALVMGDQDAVWREDWQVFNRTGITHLVSISGLHVGLLASLAGAAARALWVRASWRGRYAAAWCPAQLIAYGAAVLAAAVYCSLAGWSIPTRRTFFMLALVVAMLAARLMARPATVLMGAAAAVTLLDPWAPLAPGFWLSFGAVAILMQIVLCERARTSSWRARVLAYGHDFVRTQGAITVALLPALVFWVGSVSLVAPLANALAIPVVSVVVTPLALLAAGLTYVPGLAPAAVWVAALGHEALAILMWPMQAFAHWSWANWWVAAPPWPLMVLATVGAWWWLRAPGWPARRWACLCLLPLFTWRAERPASGHWTLTALDVGQGAAVVIETAKHVLLYDTGPRHVEGWDAGERVVLPYLRARGHRRIDRLVISHADLDHAGGAVSMLRGLPVTTLWASFDMAAWLRREVRIRQDSAPVPLAETQITCQAGQHWTVDGVTMRFVHPPVAQGTPLLGNNARSCVLLIEGQSHRALLPGDIGTAQETALLPSLAWVDVVLAPHHGSNSSSSVPFVRALNAAHVIAQAGHFSRFGHPASAVQARWQRAGAVFWRTDRDGAIIVQSRLQGLEVKSWRQARRRYWHAP